MPPVEESNQENCQENHEKEEKEEDDAVSGRAWYTLVTRPDGYCDGAICLAQSLFLVQSRYPLVIMVTSTTVENAVRQALQNSPPNSIDPNLVRITKVATVDADENVLQNLFVKQHADCLTKLRLWQSTGTLHTCRHCNEEYSDSFIFLDADMIVVKNIDSLWDTIDEPPTLGSGTPTLGSGCQCGQLWAVPNFRLKRSEFPKGNSGNLNSGLLAVHRPTMKDFGMIMDLVANFDPAWPQAEESLLNAAFKGRWNTLHPGFNLQKRVFRHAPRLWNEFLGEGNVHIVHYVGGKPWQGAEELARDWEGKEGYEALFAVWHSVRQGLYISEKADEKFDFLSHVPTAPES